LSGFVIAYISTHRETDAPTYITARVSRLWSVAVPAIVLTLVLDTIGASLSPPMYNGPWFEDSAPVLRTLANIFFVNEIWFYSIRAFSNGPYWSIGYEFWYYAIFGFAIFTTGAKRIVSIALVALLIGPKILLLLPVWLAGVWAFKTELWHRLSTWIAAALFVSTVVGYVLLRFFGAVEFLDHAVTEMVGQEFASEKLRWSRYFLSSYSIGGLIALNFVAARTLFSRFPAIEIPAAKAITYLAGFTFSLYLFHYPLLQFFSACADIFSITGHKRLAVVPATLAAVWVLGAWAEKQKGPLKHTLLSLYSRASTRAASG
jgi:peptidoglycan/LPS O-acetylase OafA/YrhL